MLVANLKVKLCPREANGCSKWKDVGEWNLEEVQFNRDFE